MSAQHTPGPWIGAGPSFGDPLPRYTTTIVTESEDDADEVVEICELPFHHHDDENEANARLIAAAPDLLEAAIKTVEENGHLADGDNCTLIHLVRAIAKTTGSTP